MVILQNEEVRDEVEMDHDNVQWHDSDYYYYYYYVFLRQISAKILIFLTELFPLTDIIKSVNETCNNI
jgi:hypothetical protein